MDLSSYNGIIFDMDGTLVDSMPAHLEAWEKTCAIHEIPFDRDWFYNLGGMPSIRIANEINRSFRQNFDTERLANTKYKFYDEIAHKGEVIEPVYQVLLDNKGTKKVAVGTGSRMFNAEPLLDQTGILPMLDALVTADDVVNHKPNPDTFLEAAKRIGVAPQDCVVFEDTELGVKAALAAGMDCYMVVDGEITTLTKAHR
ncbi:beta-phosphoglucomutase family hydrolase [Photobacterium rosenbergii]|uniref:Beta-phosphoglucomutase family hydrolase n=1 Tax=Photobacterium rosenbergii TaxID=294936 RepID=A0ABU3ZES1_9GAMM|nr:beta-phosphoglucomutase family hydrolase [Photobacterium rosenbergii]MDV5168605.1 beta-phosphoglucomutase family hydrolase [Photobacterium rosenbergii]